MSRSADGRLVTAGGRVLVVAAVAPTMNAAAGRSRWPPGSPTSRGSTSAATSAGGFEGDVAVLINLPRD